MPALTSPVQITCSADGAVATIAVTDYGSGISAEAADLLFEKFQRGSNSAGTSGAGIGLWLAQRFAQQHDGSIVIERNSEGGTSVSLQLPLQK